jgi:5-hydroxyisourate hydrolase-like protein (transthyretin family)
MADNVAIVKQPVEALNLEKVLVNGDLAGLSPLERMDYYRAVCNSVGLNPLTRPFEYIVLNDKLTLYARKDATDQLRSIHGVSIEIVERIETNGVYIVKAKATNTYGRIDEATGVVSIERENGTWETSSRGKRYFKKDGTFSPLKPDDLANAIMKAETKAKRRVTLSICGLGFLDESETDTIPDHAMKIDNNRRVQDARLSAGIDKDTVIAMLTTFGAAVPNDLTPEQCDQLVEMLEAEAQQMKRDATEEPH